MKLFAAVASALSLVGCGEGQRPFRIVQFCLNSEPDISRLKAVIVEIARANELEFTDRSADAQAEAEEIVRTVPNMKVAHPMIVLNAARSDGLGFGGTNYPEAPLQVTFGFSKGNNGVEARNFANAVVRRLSKSWVMHEVPHPESQGAFPLTKCDYVAPSA